MAARSLFEYALKMYRKLHAEEHESVGKSLMRLGINNALDNLYGLIFVYQIKIKIDNFNMKIY
jgi:hypothetical protein